MSFRCQAVVVGHVQEVGIAADIELITAIEFYGAEIEEVGQRAVDDSGAELRLKIVAEDRQTVTGEQARPFWLAGEHDGNAVYKRCSGFKCALGVELGRELGANRQKVDDDFRCHGLQDGNNLTSRQLWFFARYKAPAGWLIEHESRNAIKIGTAVDNGSRLRHIGPEHRGAVRLGKYRLRNVAAHLAF